jgi:hypothetical protein
MIPLRSPPREKGGGRSLRSPVALRIKMLRAMPLKSHSRIAQRMPRSAAIFAVEIGSINRSSFIAGIIGVNSRGLNPLFPPLLEALCPPWLAKALEELMAGLSVSLKLPTEVVSLDDRACLTDSPCDHAEVLGLHDDSHSLWLKEAFEDLC